MISSPLLFMKIKKKLRRKIKMKLNDNQTEILYGARDSDSNSFKTSLANCLFLFFFEVHLFTDL